MNYFIYIDGLLSLEQHEKWEDVRKLLCRVWGNEKLNCDKAIRLISECWYILSEWDSYIDNKNLSYQAFQNTLIECTEFSMQNFKDNARFLCVAGYMISLFPYLFFVGNADVLYLEWEQKGIGMLRRAYELNPNDKVAEILSLGQTLALSEYKKIKMSIQNELTTFFPGETVIERYFRDILSMH